MLKNLGFIGFSRNRDLSADFYPNSGGTAEIISPWVVKTTWGIFLLEDFMKLEKLVGDRFKDRPSECSVDSHALMVRGGYVKYVANGIFSSYMPLKRVTRKI